ncbi:hypothetical protein ASPZODRAFT_129629, partial [Penicilliopsis zonata CBS 506.65]
MTSSAATSDQRPTRGPVEARSLSAITSVASDPPAYPRNPTQAKLGPLVLYIVRVPGSKDVFLTPLKPAVKSSISAEAINASLYYLHVATPNDEALLQELEQEQAEERQLREVKDRLDLMTGGPEFARLNHIKRKPVPGSSAVAPAPQSHTDAVTEQPDFAPPLPRRPVPTPLSSAQINQNRDISPAVPSVKTDLPRRPLPPVPTDASPLEPCNSNLPEKRLNRWSALTGYLNNKGLDSWKEKYGSNLASKLPLQRPHSSHGAPSAGAQGLSVRLASESSFSSSPGFQITLIRRDLSSGSQWNVAIIKTSETDPGAVDIEITTPGYSKFAANNEPFSLANLGINLPSEIRQNAISMSTQQYPGHNHNSNPGSPREPPRRKHFYRKLHVSRHLDDSRNPHDVHYRASLDGGSSGMAGIYGPGSSKLKSGYYTFLSPWNGICTFSTSVNGHSLKCKHLIPTPGFSNSAVSPSASFSSSSYSSNPAATAAEIRFNGPFQASHLHQRPPHLSPPNNTNTTTGLNSSSTTDPTSSPTARSSKRGSLATFLNTKNRLSRPRSRSAVSTISTSSGSESDETSHRDRDRDRDQDQDRLDLSLAKELAGGGMRGKSAKLGKLIIDDEGIK